MRTSVGHKFKTVVMLLTGSVIALLLLSTAPLNLASDSTVIDQNPDGMTLAYGVVSIKPHKIITSYAQLTMEPDGLSAADVTLKTLILGAYALSMDAQISGLPAWAESARYDVFARMDDETATTLQKLSFIQEVTERQFMMQRLLADRFNLKIHRGYKTLPCYDLIVAKGGFKLKKADPNNHYATGLKLPEGAPRTDVIMVGSGKLAGQAISLSRLATQLTTLINTLVVDKSGLTGKYDVLLEWVPDGSRLAPMPQVTTPLSQSESGPSIFTALQEQLGLDLKPSNTQMDVIVIDHVEQP